MQNSSNTTEEIWWIDTEGMDENALFSGIFLPPPPRPIFLEGLEDLMQNTDPTAFTYCDLCTWAIQKNYNEFSSTILDTSLELPNQIGWVFTLIIVSIISASLGAIIMIIFLHCRRAKISANNVENIDISRRPPIDLPNDKDNNIHSIALSSFPYSNSGSNANNSVWCWLSKRNGPSAQLENGSNHVENHYTHMEENYANGDEALYAELDDGSGGQTSTSSYQNSAYTDPDAMQITSSAPSSAYYSDLSLSITQTQSPSTVTVDHHRAYEIVNLVNNNANLDGKLSAINEHVPSNYI